MTASPWPPLAAARVAGRARSRKPDVPPSSLPPVAPGARRAVSAQGSRHKCAYGALALRSAPRPSAPPPPSSPRAPARCGASSLASAWALASSGGARPVPPCPPLAAARGKACSRSPGGAPAPGWRRAFKCVRRPPREKSWCCLAAARHICAALFRRRGNFRGFARRSRAGALARSVYRASRLSAKDTPRLHSLPSR